MMKKQYILYSFLLALLFLSVNSLAINEYNVELTTNNVYYSMGDQLECLMHTTKNNENHTSLITYVILQKNDGVEQAYNVEEISTGLFSFKLPLNEIELGNYNITAQITTNDGVYKTHKEIEIISNEWKVFYKEKFITNVWFLIICGIILFLIIFFSLKLLKKM